MNRGAVPGCVVSDDLLRVLEQEATDPDKGRAKSLERAAKMLALFKGMGFRGAHLAGFALKFEEIQKILQRADELAPQWEAFVPDVSFARPGEFYLFPEPTSYRPAAQPDPDPIPALRGGSEGLKSRLLRSVHGAIFVPDTPGYRLMRRYYQALDGKKALSAVSHILELVGKRLLVGCRDCGDCALSAMANCCPMSQCPKNLRNGPCGGTRNGQCEVYEDRPCVWTTVYRRLKATGRLDELRSGWVGPRDARLEGTSGWCNFYLKRDHQGRPAVAEASAGKH
jgi:methylenetetrahydrofolate reductase (NADPH)